MYVLSINVYTSNYSFNSIFFVFFQYIDFIILTCPFSVKEAEKFTCNITLKFPQAYDHITDHTISISFDGQEKDINVAGKSGVFKESLGLQGYYAIKVQEKYFNTSSTAYVLVTESKYSSYLESNLI